MAFSQGKESSNSSSVNFKKFVGVGSVKVLAMNPNVETWNKITGGSSTDEKVYIGDKDGVKYAKVTFLVEIDGDRSLDNSTGVIPMTFWLRKSAIKGTNSGKIKIIDKYGRTAWATEEEIAEKKIPQYTNGPANIDADYRKCVAGEEELTTFLKTLMCIPNPTIYNRTTQTWEKNPNLQECEARLDKIMKYFDGDFSEIKNILKSFPNNKVRVLFGVKKTDDKEYQDFLPSVFVSNGSSNNLPFQKELKNALSVGRYQSTYFGETDSAGDPLIKDIREYKIEATEYTDSNKSTPNTDTFDTLPSTTTSNVEEDDLPF